jgi:hypothetical protein
MHKTNTKQPDRLASVRESFSARLLTDRQFSEAIAITGIIETEIRETGSFKEKLGDYSYAFARSQTFDAVKSETIIRDLFKERTGQTMNQMREGLAEQEDKITDDSRAKAYSRACAIGDVMESGVKVTFHRAYAQEAQQLGAELGVTDACAKRLMREEFASAEGSELVDWGKELDETVYRPQIEAKKSERAAPREEPAERGRQPRRAAQRTRSGPQ